MLKHPRPISPMVPVREPRPLARRVLPEQGTPRPSGAPRSGRNLPRRRAGLFIALDQFRAVAPPIRCSGWRIAGSFSRTIPISPGLPGFWLIPSAERMRLAGALKAGQGLILLYSSPPAQHPALGAPGSLKFAYAAAAGGSGSLTPISPGLRVMRTIRRAHAAGTSPKAGHGAHVLCRPRPECQHIARRRSVLLRTPPSGPTGGHARPAGG